MIGTGRSNAPRSPKTGQACPHAPGRTAFQTPAGNTASSGAGLGRNAPCRKRNRPRHRGRCLEQQWTRRRPTSGSKTCWTEPGRCSRSQIQHSRIVRSSPFPVPIGRDEKSGIPPCTKGRKTAMPSFVYIQTIPRRPGLIEIGMTGWDGVK